MTDEQTTAVAVKKDSPVKKFTDALTSPVMQKRIASVLPKHMTPERVIKIAISAISRNPLLLQCTTESVLKGVIISSELGLELNGALGHAYLVPFKNKNGNYEAQFIAGYKGMVELARRSGYVVGVEARAVYDNDFFEYEYGLNPKLIHRPTTAGETGKLKYVYAINRYKNGFNEFVVLATPEVNRHRERSKARDSGPWVSDFEAMALKTAVRVLMKLSPQSPEMANAIEVEERTDRGERGLADLGFQSALDNLDDGTGVDVMPTRTEELKTAMSNDQPAPATPAAPESSGELTAAQGDELNRIAEILTALGGIDTARRKALLTNWSDAKVDKLTSLKHFPELISTVLDRAKITSQEAEDAAQAETGKKGA